MTTSLLCLSQLRTCLGLGSGVSQCIPACSSASSMQTLHSLAAAAASQWRGISSSPAAAYAPQPSNPQLQQQQQQQQQQQHQQPSPATPPPSETALPTQQQQHTKQQQQQHDQQQQQQQQLDPVVQQLAQQYQRSRLLDYYNHHLSREMMLKLGVGSVQQLPRVKSIDLSIIAKDLMGKRYVEKWEMLLPALALEYISGQPATFLYSTVKYYRSRNAVTGVKVRLTGGAALDLLQKLTHIVLPSQNGFAGVDSRSFDRAGNLHFRVPRMVNFPDFEEQFEIFENLGALHVSINIANATRGSKRGSGSSSRSQLLLTGLQLPILNKKKGAAAADGAGGDAAAAAAGEQEERDSDDEGSSSGEE